MTKNKKQKAAIREIARTKGVSFTHAALIDERKCQQKPLDPAMQFILNREKRAGWLLTTFEGSDFKVHFDSDSPDSLINDPDDAKNSGIPHFVIAKGTQAQRFRFLNGIRRQFDGHFAANANVLNKKNLQTTLIALSMMHQMRTTETTETFAELREQFIKEKGTAMVDFAPAYNYVFIYDWDELMADISDEWKDMVHFLLENGKKSGIHFIISVGNEDGYTTAWDEQGLVRFITIRSPYSGHSESAVARIGGIWKNLQIPTW